MVGGGVFIALGSNLGDRAALLNAALQRLNQVPGVRVLRASRFHETSPVGGPPHQGMYLNAVAELACDISAHELMRELLRIEQELGRERGVSNGPRTIDLDLLLFGELRIETPELTLPHPRMHERAFVLVPLAELRSAAVPTDAQSGLPNQPVTSSNF